MSQMITIDTHNAQQHIDPWVGPDGLPRAKGYIPRDRKTHPHGMLGAKAPSFDLDLIPEQDWPKWIARQEQDQSSCQHFRNIGMNGQLIPSRDQNGKSYCWMHSGVSCALIARARQGLPYADLSAYAGACMIKNYRDEGGNGIDGIEFQVDRGIPTSQFWPQKSMSRSNDNPATWANAALHKIGKFLECSSDDRTRRLQVATASLLGYPVIADYNWWSHSVMFARLLSAIKGRIWNSWSDDWSENGMGDLAENHMWPDDAWVLVIDEASA